MKKPFIQIDDLVREMTDEEHQVYLAAQTNQAEQEAEAQAKIEARQSALAKLALLGLTQNEIDAL
jgi:hypothetical protein